jgi:hypothetical protein
MTTIITWIVCRLEESRNPEAGAPLDVVGVLLVITGVGAVAFGLVRSAGFALVTALLALPVDTWPR